MAFEIMPSANNDMQTGIVSAGIGAGIIYGIVKKKSPAIIFVYALGFGIVTLGATSVISKITTS